MNISPDFPLESQPEVRPVWAREGRSPIHIQKILVPTDFSASAEHALAYAKQLAQHFHAELVLLHVMPFAYAPGRYMPPDYFDAQVATHEDAEAKLEALKDDRVTETLLTEGRADDEIVRLAGELQADLVIISTHGSTGFRHLLIGGTAERVVRHAPCPVLVVKQHEHEFLDCEES